MKRRFIVAVTVAASVVLVAAGCGDKYTEPFQDAPRAGAANSAPAQIIEMPDGFSNLATKCVGDIRYTVAYHFDNPYASVSTVVDPQCPKQ